jgi:hypothetical protein
MNSVLKLSFVNNCGNLIWMPPYLYPIDDLENGIEDLRASGYWVSAFPEGDGLTFKMEDPSKKESFKDFEISFPWMNITNYNQDEEFDFEKDLFNFQIVMLPLTRLRIKSSLLSKNICIFPAGELSLESLNIIVPGKLDIDNIEESSKSNDLRTLITSCTHIDKEVFYHNPIVVFRDTISIAEYKILSHKDDVALIKKYSERAEDVLDLIRFFECDYLTPEMLPAKAGIWDDKYSAALIYFPKDQIGFVQSREVEIKTNIKGIGADFYRTDLINQQPIFIYSNEEVGDVGRISKYALRLNSLIAESENQSNKFIHIMTLFEYLGNPNKYEQFQKIKGKIITYIAKNKTDYNKLSTKFIYYSKDLRTEIIHNGKRIEYLLTQVEIDEMFKFFHQTIYIIIWDMMMNFDENWNDYEAEREIKRKQLIA